MKPPKLINLTPHNITFTSGINIRPSGTIARLEESTIVADTFLYLGGPESITIKEKHFGPPFGLPDPAPNTLLIVSALVANSCPERTDLVGVEITNTRTGIQVTALIKRVR